MSLLASITCLTISGTPGLEAWDEGAAVAKSASDTTSISVSESTSVATFDAVEWTELSVGAVPGPKRAAIGAVTPPTTVEFTVSDSASVSVTESPVDGFEFDTAETVLLSVSESAQLFNSMDLTDTASVNVSESVSIEVSGTLETDVTDTASLTLSEVVGLDVEIAVVDDAAISVSDSGAVDVFEEFISVTDTASLSVSENAVLDISSGAVDVTVGDDGLLSVTEVAIVQAFSRPGAAREVARVLRRQDVYTLH